MALPDPTQSRAVLIGVSKYKRLPKMPAVRNNLDALAEVLAAPWSWNLPTANCQVVRDPHATHDVVKVVEEAAGTATDSLLIYYAGHGVTDADDNYALHLALKNSTNEAHTALRYHYLRTLIRRSRAKRKIVILDCCFAARAFADTMSDAATNLSAQSVVEGTYVLAAAGETKSALADDGEGHTVFTGKLLQLLREGVDDGSNLLHLERIYAELYHRLRLESRPLPQVSGRNTAGQLALAWNRFHGPQSNTSTVQGVAQPSNGIPSDGQNKVAEPPPSVDESTVRTWDPEQAAREQRRTEIGRLRSRLSKSVGDHRDRRRTAERLAILAPEFTDESARSLREIVADPTAVGVERRWAAETLRDLGAEYQEETRQVLSDMCAAPDLYGLSELQARTLLTKLNAGTTPVEP